MEKGVRQLINDGCFFENYFCKHRADWRKLCSAMDVIGDTCLTTEAFMSRTSENHGEKYLRLYGFLQACYLQQDAIKSIYDIVFFAFGSTAGPWRWEDNEMTFWRELRKFRNASCGHPVKCNTWIGGREVSTFIARYSLEGSGRSVKLTTFDENVGDIQVDLGGLYSRYEAEAKSILMKIAVALGSVRWDIQY
jgi:hypothetical protein